MKKVLLRWFLRAARLTGMFAAARRWTRNDFRILCYHGAAVGDENGFRPGLFMTAETFAARLRFLDDHDYPVIPLDELPERLRTGTLPECATVITIDDGWYGSYLVMAKALKAREFPATLYLASYYMEKQTQVFNVALDYALWKGRGRTIDLSQVAPGLGGRHDLSDGEQRAAAWSAICDFGEALDGAEQRQSLLRRTCDVCDVDWGRIERERLISFMSADEARESLELGIDIQLHTHRHEFPVAFERAATEIEDNRRALRKVTDRPLRHFCYPSGIYEETQLPWLDSLGIVTATTTRRGFNRRDASLSELRRFLDSDAISPIEFEAEMCGFLELIRRCGYPI